MLVKKKDRSYRFCVDYRKLNLVTKQDAHPLPRVDDLLDSLNGYKMFSTLDVRSGYWQLSMHPDDRENTLETRTLATVAAFWSVLGNASHHLVKWSINTKICLLP